MGELLIRPDFSKLKQYYNFRFELTKEKEKRYLENGIAFDTRLVHTEKEAQEFILEFEQILKKHKIEEHMDNLVYICLYYYENYWDPHDFFAGYRYAKKKVDELTYEEKPYFYINDLRAKEMAQLIDLYNKRKDKDEFKIIVKPMQSVIDEPVSIEDKTLSKWIIELIINAVKEGNYPIEFIDGIGLFNIGPNGVSWEPGQLNEEEIKKALKKHPVIDRAAQNDEIAKFCIYLRRYLSNIEILKSKAAVPANQFKILNEILICFGILERKYKDKFKKSKGLDHSILVRDYKDFIKRNNKRLEKQSEEERKYNQIF